MPSATRPVSAPGGRRPSPQPDDSLPGTPPRPGRRRRHHRPSGGTHPSRGPGPATGGPPRASHRGGSSRGRARGAQPGDDRERNRPDSHLQLGAYAAPVRQHGERCRRLVASHCRSCTGVRAADGSNRSSEDQKRRERIMTDMSPIRPLRRLLPTRFPLSFTHFTGTNYIGVIPQQTSHGGSQGFKSPHLHPKHCRSERRQRRAGGALCNHKSPSSRKAYSDQATRPLAPTMTTERSRRAAKASGLRNLPFWGFDANDAWLTWS
jgi:hypothetical protein